jgi:hypothetical protein
MTYDPQQGSIHHKSYNEKAKKMSSAYLPGQQIPGLQASSEMNSGSSTGTNTNQVYQDMGQNNQQFGQHYQQAIQAVNQMQSATSTQQQQLQQYLQALQTALAGMNNQSPAIPLTQPSATAGTDGALTPTNVFGQYSGEIYGNPSSMYDPKFRI